MAKWIVDSSEMTTLEKLDDTTQRRIRREMVENAAKVLVKEMQASIEGNHHVINRYMKDAVAPGPVYEDIDGTSIEVWPQGDDPRGVSNEMKLKIIEYGYYDSFSGRRHKKIDYFLNDSFRKKCEPRILAVMNATLAHCIDELNK